MAACSLCQTIAVADADDAVLCWPEMPASCHLLYKRLHG